MTTLNAGYGFPRSCANCDAVECLYCGTALSKRHEHDHFPVPARAGGNNVVPACYNCHDLKDRMRMLEWPVPMYVMAVRDLTAALDIDAAQLPEAVLNDPAECLSTVLREVLDNIGLHQTTAWQELPTAGRLLFAKLCSLLTGDHPVDTDEQREHRRELLAPWVDRESTRYSDAGPTTRNGLPFRST